MTFWPARLAIGTNQVHTTGSQCNFCQDPGTLHSRCNGRCDLQHPWAQSQRPSTSKSHSQFLVVFLLYPNFGLPCLLALHDPKSKWYWWDHFPKGPGPSLRCPKDKLKYWMSSPISNFSRKKTHYIGPWKYLKQTIPHGKLPPHSPYAH